MLYNVKTKSEKRKEKRADKKAEKTALKKCKRAAIMETAEKEAAARFCESFYIQNKRKNDFYPII